MLRRGRGRPPAGRRERRGGDSRPLPELHARAPTAPARWTRRTKRLLAIALSVLSRCEPCAKLHIAKAREMGISQAEIDEAAWMAIAFGGGPAEDVL